MDSNILRKVSYGLYVISSTQQGRINGQIANTVFQISSEPPTVAISINKNNLTHEYIKESKIFSVSILSNSVPMGTIGNFGFKSGRDIDKFQSVSFKLGETGAPILLENTVGYFEAEVISSLEVETHTVFIGKLINSEVLSDEEPMTYAYYQQLKKGSEKPLHIKKDTKKEDNKMKKYECTVCGYVYDPAVGDQDSGIAPGTAFEDIPEDWVCPTCGVSKSEFQPVD